LEALLGRRYTLLRFFARAGRRHTRVQGDRRSIHSDKGVCLNTCVGVGGRGIGDGRRSACAGAGTLNRVSRTLRANASRAAFGVLSEASSARAIGAVHCRARVRRGTGTRAHVATAGILEHPVGAVHSAHHLWAG